MCKPLPIVLAALLSLFSAAQTKAPKKGTVCWPLNFAGITVGVSSDSQVQRLLGSKGVFRPDEGHTGGRYFIDTKRTATLHIVGGVDRIVEELTISLGIDATVKRADASTAVSKWFEPQERFGNWHDLHLGSLKTDVLGIWENRKKELTRTDGVTSRLVAAKSPRT